MILHHFREQQFDYDFLLVLMMYVSIKSSPLLGSIRTFFFVLLIYKNNIFFLNKRMHKKHKQKIIQNSIFFIEWLRAY